MHLLSLNLPDLLLPLWCATIECDSHDDKTTWEWAALSNSDVWKAHGEHVAAAIVDIPSSFGHPPRNPAEKINSGYKAWEFHLYLWGLGPGLLCDILPTPYWQNFCKLAHAVRPITQHSITRDELKMAITLLLQFTQEFEQLYYQRKIEWLHFVWQKHCLSSLYELYKYRVTSTVVQLATSLTTHFPSHPKLLCLEQAQGTPTNGCEHEWPFHL